MNDITGNSDADNIKYDELKKQRDALFMKALPYLEKTATLYAANEINLREEDKNTYHLTLKTLMTLYQHLSQMDKCEATKKKLEAMNR